MDQSDIPCEIGFASDGLLEKVASQSSEFMDLHGKPSTAGFCALLVLDGLLGRVLRNSFGDRRNKSTPVTCFFLLGQTQLFYETVLRRF